MISIVAQSANKLKYDSSVGFQLEENVVYDLDGNLAKLSDLWKEKPVLLITGSLSCPFTRKSLKQGNKLFSKFKDDINFAVVYVIDAHPKGDNSPYSGDEWIPRANFKDNILIPQPKGQSERNTRAVELKKLLGLNIPVIVDGMDNLNWKSLGKFPNAGILIDKNGKVIYKQKKFKASLMAKKLKNYLSTGSVRK